MPTAQQIAQVFQNYVDAMSAGDVEKLFRCMRPTP